LFTHLEFQHLLCLVFLVEADLGFLLKVRDNGTYRFLVKVDFVSLKSLFSRALCLLLVGLFSPLLLLALLELGNLGLLLLEVLLLPDLTLKRRLQLLVFLLQLVLKLYKLLADLFFAVL